MTMLTLRLSLSTCYKSGAAELTRRIALLVTVRYEAEMVAEVEKRTVDVFTVKVALVAPVGTRTLEGTLATPVLLLESTTSPPPAAAGPLSVTMPVEGLPPVTVEGFSVSEERVGTGEGAVSESA